MTELLEWQDHDGHLSGTFKYMWLSGRAPTEAVNTVSAGLSGTLKGNAITLNLGFSHPLHGSIDGGQFSLNLPQPKGAPKEIICQPATTADWNNATTALYNQLNDDNNRPAGQAGG